MKKSIVILAAVLLTMTVSPLFAADDVSAPAPAAAAASSQSEAAPENVPAMVSTGTENAIVKPQSAEPAFEMLNRIETIVYGMPHDGGLLNRLNEVEKAVFGRDLPGSLTERQTALLDFLEKGTGAQPSLLFKLSVAEWALEQQIRPTWSLVKRIDSMENILEGASQEGALVSRVERLLTKLLPDGVNAVPCVLPKSTIFKAALRETLTVKNVKVDDIIIMGLNEQVVIGNNLVAPKNSRVFGHITKVKPPRSFGRPSEIEMLIDSVEVLGPSIVQVDFGEAAKKAMDVDSGVLGAAGASIGGAVLLGPIGLAGGFLVRGNDKQLKEGTLFYVETKEEVKVPAYAVPHQITPITQPETSAPQGTKSAPIQ